MRIVNAKVFVNGKFLEGGIEFNEKIEAIGPEVKKDETSLDAGSSYLIPGLIDIHTHGGLGVDSSYPDQEGLLKLSRYYAQKGVTSFCPTTMTLTEDELSSAIKEIVSFKNTPKTAKNGAKIAGINLEGPFLSKEKCGAQDAEKLEIPSIEEFLRLFNISEGSIAITSIAPELSGAMEYIKEASKYAVVSLAHTAADYETSMKAFENGASHVTHLFNGMNGLHHRNPGLVGAAFDSKASVELICDGYHINETVLKMAFILFSDRLCLISDSLKDSGLVKGPFYVQGTDTLAGSSIHLMDGLKYLVGIGIPLEKVVLASTLSPAKAIRKDNEIGSLDIGKKADFVLLDKDLNVKDVYIEGKRWE